MTREEFIDLIRQNVVLKDKVDSLTSIQTEVKNNIRDGIKTIGEEDDRGNVVVDLEDAGLPVSKAMQQRKVSKSLDMEIAEQILRDKGLYDRCVMMIPALDEQEIMAAYYDGAITEEDIDAMFPAKVTWALVIK